MSFYKKIFTAQNIGLINFGEQVEIARIVCGCATGLERVSLGFLVMCM